jgi:uncharacterized sporulation protein YeaH/YhbH (DUF444 family)
MDENKLPQIHFFDSDKLYIPNLMNGIYEYNDFDIILGMSNFKNQYQVGLQTLEELMSRDNQREADGFPKRIKIGKLVKPTKGNKGQVIVVPTTDEPKFFHDNSISNEEESSGAGDGEEGEVIGEQKAEQEGEGEGQGAGQGGGGDHDVTSEAFNLGKILTEKFQLPNIKNKGKKPSLTKYTYDLTDKNRGFGQLLDKKATIKKIIETNILLGNITGNEKFEAEDLIINPKDKIFRIMSKEKDFEAQAVVFFVRDYSGSMQGPPTEVITSQHLLIYSWLMYQYQNNVQTRFIVHDTEAKEVPDFYTYYKYQVAGGTQVYPAFELVNKIIAEEQLAKDFNIYVFYGTDGDDWEQKGEKLIAEIRTLLKSINRLGITVAKNQWTYGSTQTTVEKNIESSGLLKEKPELIRMDSLKSDEATEDRIIEGIKKLVSE